MSVVLAKPRKTSRTTVEIWTREKPGLLKSHRGWFVAYRGRQRVALEPTVERLLAALDEKLGSPAQTLRSAPDRRGATAPAGTGPPPPRTQPRGEVGETAMPGGDWTW